MNDSMGDRMKRYEAVGDIKLTNRLPVIIRLDGRSFHSWTKKAKCAKPYCKRLSDLMADTTAYLCENISGAVLGYCQSDEISILVLDDKTHETQPWFDNRLQKMVSISAAMATYYFNANVWDMDKENPAFFDARAFVIPREDVTNYFIWRQRDATRNSISMLAQSLYSAKELHGKNSDEKQEMCWQKGHNWNDVPTVHKRGTLVYKQTSPVAKQNPKTGELFYRKKFLKHSDTPIFHYGEDDVIARIIEDYYNKNN